MSEGTYKVVKKVVRAVRDGEELDFDVHRYYATFFCKEPTIKTAFGDPFLEVWTDGSIVLHNGKDSDDAVFLYDDQWLGIIKCIEMAILEKKQKHEERRQKWLDETADLKTFEGINVDLSRNETIAALESCVISVIQQDRYTDPVILFGGKEYRLGRTDLFDNVATGLCKQWTAEEWRAHYLRIARACMGARLNEFESGGCFSVIDSLTDG